MKQIALLLLKFYRLAISPLMPPHCRFEPTCSAYAQEAIQHYGFARGSLLTLRRLSKCHPWHAGGYDPVPGARCCRGPDQPEFNPTDSK
ncbi:MAG: membrane protein insertion efficiency factor YidD [Pseudomonadales bacterium]|nr:membrane protein insertion efficiency factor YidD [Pseudomonadales bacterium]MEC8812925.1 membrane protein insertion efficiency factor YidD [Pseudomonadota bacterium]HAG94862.1 membrane protein insertion efficiency factor YidD [Gammaproteobacteria bacterium]MBI25375.1 membrane protein insertion efficiency factor YidD [Pseudomonadales bacterium]HAU13251.1 membrane protein insertion efficiency factor YidD [Gammaproteobacteria bacterium]